MISGKKTENAKNRDRHDLSSRAPAAAGAFLYASKKQGKKQDRHGLSFRAPASAHGCLKVLIGFALIGHFAVLSFHPDGLQALSVLKSH